MTTSTTMSPPAKKARVRPPQRLPEHVEGEQEISLDPSHKVVIKHPGYEEGQNILLVLPALDQSQGGLDHETALVMCGIVTGNSWDGCFTRPGSDECLSKDTLAVLPAGDYYFYPQRPTNTDVLHVSYPIVPDFSSWCYPRGNLPSYWNDYGSATSTSVLPPSGSNASIALRMRDGYKCRVSGHEEVCEMAHLCPAAENTWFHDNGMHRYIYKTGQPGSAAINDINNLVLLRSDLHTSFDRRKFVIVPKQDPTSCEIKLVVHILEYSQELARLYHIVELQSGLRVPPPFLFVRLAWALFPLLEGFLQANVQRALLVKGKVQPRVSAEQCRTYTTQPGARSRTNSSKKRSRGEDVPVDDQGLHQHEWTDLHRRKKRRHLSPVLSSSSSIPSQNEATALAPAIVSPAPLIAAPGLGRSKRRASAPTKVRGCVVNSYIDRSPTRSEGLPTIGLADDLSTSDQLHTPSASLSPPLFHALPSSHREDHLEAMKQRMLAVERARSDNEGRWLSELEESQDGVINGAVTTSALRRYYEAMGIEIVD